MTQQTIRVRELDDDTNILINENLKTLNDKKRRNLLRLKHYDAKRQVQQVASILPPQYSQLALSLGWTGKAVDLLARRCNLTGFTWAGGDLDTLGYDEVWRDNSMVSQSNQGITSALIHSASIATTVGGEVDEGEPDVLIQYHSALDATGVWAPRTHALTSAFVVNSRREDYVTGFTLHEYGQITSCVFDDGKWQVTESEPHEYGMTADVLPYRARLGRPFGSSRITRPMMSIQDSAIRELLRLEGHMDIYSYPELWLLGADLSVFTNLDGSQMTDDQRKMGRYKGIPDDDKAANPRVDVKHIPASSPEPHLAALNASAKMFAREASLPDSSVAITDISNPTSAESYDASQYELIAEAEGACDDWSPAQARVFARALAMKNEDPALMDDLRTLTPRWRNPRFLTRAAEADAGMKQLTAAPWLAETEVGLELLGLTDQQIEQAMADKDRAQSTSVALSVINAARGGGQALIDAEQTEDVVDDGDFPPIS